MTTKKTSKNIKKFECEICDFECCKKGDYDRHISTGKHKRQQNASNRQPENAKHSQNDFTCICGKSYKHRGSLFKHTKTCTFVEEKEEEETTIVQNTQNSGEATTELFTQLIEKVINPLVKNQ